MASFQSAPWQSPYEVSGDTSWNPSQSSSPSFPEPGVNMSFSGNTSTNNPGINNPWTSNASATSDTGFGPTHFANWASTINSQNKPKYWAPPHAYAANVEQDSFADVCATVDSWLPDSGATAHMTFDANLVHNAKIYTGHDKVVVGNESDRPASSSHSSKSVYCLWSLCKLIHYFIFSSVSAMA